MQYPLNQYPPYPQTLFLLIPFSFPVSPTTTTTQQAPPPPPPPPPTTIANSLDRRRAFLFLIVYLSSFLPRLSKFLPVFLSSQNVAASVEATMPTGRLEITWNVNVQSPVVLQLIFWNPGRTGLAEVQTL
ncbi:hypothetical protein CMV_004836 [Castanea mollissima]|uniref:Uncharacterized protein n=1 Tax=Castanea mollissima TaxID=60419 RepID=A0A8J4RXU5_9ROSI|nr:hypothetical protein CMV_004836 [Castanea mollissima]